MDPLAEIEALKARIARLEKLAGLDVPAPPVPAPVSPPLPEAPVSTFAPPPAAPLAPSPAPEPSFAPPPESKYAPPSASALSFTPPSTATPPAEAPPFTPPPLPVSPPAAPPLVPQATPQSAPLAASEAWLARIGIGLLFIGLLFFLKLSLDRGWITPALQLGIGAGVCVALLVWGDRLSRYRPSMGNLAFGGGIAGLIGVLAAGQNLHNLYGGGVTCGLSLLVALVCFTQALRRNSAVLCNLALLGTAVAPFFLGLTDVTLLAVDSLIAAALALATYLFRGWRSVLWVGAATSWTLLFASVATKWFNSASGEVFLIQAAICAVWLGFWLVPVVRYLWKDSQDVAGLWLTAFLPGLAAMFASGLLWGESSRGTIGGALLVLCGLSAVLGWSLRSRTSLASAQFCGAAIFGGLAIPVILSGLPCWIVLAAYAVALHLAARATQERPLQVVAYLSTVVCYGAFLVIAAQIALSYDAGWSQVVSTVALLASVVGAAFLTMGRPSSGVLRAFSYLGAIVLILAAAAQGVFLSSGWATFLCGVVAVAAWLGAFGVRTIGQQVLAHTIFAVLAFAILIQLLNEGSPTPWFNPSACAACGILLLALFPAFLTTSRSERLTYLHGLHIMVLILLWTQFREVGDGAAVSVSWAVCAVVLIIAGVFRDSRPLRVAGMATLVLLLIRLFMVDLAQLDLAAKTLIFLGIGLLLFVAGYFLPKFLPTSSQKVP